MHYIVNSVCDFYQRSNSIINDFRVCNIETLDTLNYIFCMHMYGCELWNLSYGSIEKFKIAWRKVKRRIWNIPYNTHNVLVHNQSSNINVVLETRVIKFIHNSLTHNSVCRQLLFSKLFVKIPVLQIIIDLHHINMKYLPLIRNKIYLI